VCVCGVCVVCVCVCVCAGQITRAVLGGWGCMARLGLGEERWIDCWWENLRELGWEGLEWIDLARDMEKLNTLKHFA